MPTLTVAGHSVTVGDEFLKLSPEEQNSTVDEIAKSLPGQKGSGVVAGAAHGVADLARGLASTAGLTGAQTPGLDNIAAKVDPKDYHAAPLIREGGSWINPKDYQLSNIPQIAAEAFPGLATDFAAGTVGARLGKQFGGVKGAAIGGIGGGLASLAARTFGTGAHENAAARTGDVNAPVTGGDMGREAAKQIVEAPLNAFGFGKLIPGVGAKITSVGAEGAGKALKKYISTIGAEGVSGAANDVIGQVGTQLGNKDVDIEGNRAATAGIARGLASGAMVTPRLAANLAGAVKDRAFGGDNAAATTAVAGRLKDAADGGSMSSPKEGGAAFDTTRSNIHAELRSAAKDLETPLSPDGESVLSRATAGKKLTETDFNRLSRDVEGDAAGEQVVALARQAHVAAMLKDQGEVRADGTFIGGITNSVGKHIRAIANPIGVGTSALLGATVGGSGAAALMGAHSIPALAAIAGGYAGMRGIDALTGMRSPANRFADKFHEEGAPTRPDAPAALDPVVPEPETPSLRNTLKSNVQIDEGMAKIAKNIQAAKQKALIAETMPAVKQLAQQQGPNAKPLELPEDFAATLGGRAPAPEPAAPAPDFNPTALKMLQQKLKTGLPPPPTEDMTPVPTNVAALDAPPAPPSFNPTALKMLQAKLKAGLPPEPVAPSQEAPETPNINSTALRMVQKKMKLGLPPEPAATAAPLPVPGPASQPISALMTKLASRAPMAEPAAPAAPAEAPVMPTDPAPVTAKISKKKGKAVEVTAHPTEAPASPALAKVLKKIKEPKAEAPAEPFKEEYVPLTAEEKLYGSMTDAAAADHAASLPGVRMPEKHKAGTVRNRNAIRGPILEVVGNNSGKNAEHAAKLMAELFDIGGSQGKRATGAIQHFTKGMSPKFRTLMRAKLDHSYVNSIWRS